MFVAEESVLHIRKSQIASLIMRPVLCLEKSATNYPVTRCHSQEECSFFFLDQYLLCNFILYSMIVPVAVDTVVPLMMGV